MLEIEEYENEYGPSNPEVGLLEESLSDVENYSDEDSDFEIDYENAHLAFDPEKSPKFNC